MRRIEHSAIPALSPNDLAIALQRIDLLAIDAAAKEISLLQTSLGELHDCDVWLDHLAARLKQTARRSSHHETNACVRAGATWLIRHFAAERMEHYRAALGRWQEWTTSGFLVNLERSLGSEQ